MAEIDFNQVYNGVTLALHRFFPKSRIHGEDVKQGLKEGDFIVIPIRANSKAEIGSRNQQKAVFDIVYFPTTIGGRTECLMRAGELTEILRTVETPNKDMVHCLSFDFEIEDNTLHCSVEYPFFVFEAREQSKMENISIT